MSTSDEQIRLILDMGQSGANVEEVRVKLEQLDAAAHKTARATDELTKSSVNTGQAMLNAGRLIQDFAQGGIGGVLNNVEGLATYPLEPERPDWLASSPRHGRCVLPCLPTRQVFLPDDD